jgi:hypothetical protein
VGLHWATPNFVFKNKLFLEEEERLTREDEYMKSTTMNMTLKRKKWKRMRTRLMEFR